MQRDVRKWRPEEEPRQRELLKIDKYCPFEKNKKTKNKLAITCSITVVTNKYELRVMQAPKKQY